MIPLSHDVIADTNLVDIPLLGYPYTWWKTKGTIDAGEEKLGRALARQDWLNIFPNCYLLNSLNGVFEFSHYFMMVRLVIPLLISSQKSTHVRMIYWLGGIVYICFKEDIKTKEEISETLGVTECLEIGKYLGMSSMIGRKKKSVFGYLRDTIWRKIQQWSRKHLSKAGREIFYQIYCTGHLILLKEDGGMSFKHLDAFNLAMLGKQGWKLVSHVFKTKYHPKGDFLGSSVGHNPSNTWPGNNWEMEMYNTNVWWDPWLRVSNSPYIATPVIEGLENLTLSSLVNITKLQWSFSRDECYSVKSAYFHIMENYGTSVCIRDNNGNFLTPMTSWFLGIPLPLEAEARAIHFALDWLALGSNTNIIIETTSSQGSSRIMKLETSFQSVQQNSLFSKIVISSL
ncbi:hypothetical protein HKD37_07G019792 [Glycine soja]